MFYRALKASVYTKEIQVTSVYITFLYRAIENAVANTINATYAVAHDVKVKCKTGEYTTALPERLYSD